MPIQRPDRRATNRAYLAIAGAALVVIGCLLPWAMEDTGFGTVGIKGTSAGGGQFDLVLGLAVIVLTVLFLAGRTGWKSSVLSLTLTVLIVVVCIANMVDISRTIDKEKASDTTALIGSSSSTTVGIGIILVLVGGCIAAVAVLLTMVGKRGHGRR